MKKIIFLLCFVLTLQLFSADTGEKSVARQLLDMTVMSDPTLWRVSAGLRTRPQWIKIKKLYDEKKYDEALTALRDYYCDKMTNPRDYGLLSEEFNPFSSGAGGLGWWPAASFRKNRPEESIAAADLLLAGKVKIGNKEFALGKPGKANWLLPLDKNTVDDSDQQPAMAVLNGNILTDLLQAWTITGKEEYLKTYLAYLEDWADNSTYYRDIHPCKVGSLMVGGVAGAWNLLRNFAVIANSPGGREKIPPELFAKVIIKILHESNFPSMAYLRSNCHNWTPGVGLFLNSFLLNEFLVSEEFFREARRRNLEDNAVTQNLPDGTENQQCPWYNDNYYQVYHALRLLGNSRNSEWQLPLWWNKLRKDALWHREIRENLNLHASYALRNRTQQNVLPLGWDSGIRRGAPATGWNINYLSFLEAVPEAVNDPENFAIMMATMHPGNGIRPTITGNWFPYGGYNIVWDGWEIDDGYGSLFCSPHPGAYGGYRSMKNNNAFALNGYGQDLLISDATGNYMVQGSPLKIDGKSEFFHAGYYKAGGKAAHKTWMISAWDKPGNFRHHASDKYNLMEGEYRGPWDNTTEPKPLNLCTTGAVFNRQVMLVRELKLWIVIDRVDYPGKHAFEQIWHLPVKPNGNPAFAPEEFAFDSKAKCFKTTSKEAKKVNLTARQFSSSDLEYSSKNVIRDTKNRFSSSRKEVSVRYHGENHAMVISLFEAIPPGRESIIEEIKQVTPSTGVCGFSARTRNGQLVTLLAAENGTARLAADGISVEAETLLAVKNKAVVSGIILGENRGRNNCEFAVTGGKRQNIPIYRPVEQVKFSPEQDKFYDTLAVSITCPTPGTFITYTTDGSDPTPQSSRYTKPVTLERSTLLRARAYRDGVTENPKMDSTTHASPAGYAWFEKTPFVDPVSVSGLKNGLEVKYYEGPYQKLWMFLNELKPLKTGVAGDLFDLSIIPDSNPRLSRKMTPRKKYYALEYDGYLDIPADGTYVFQAPRELVWPDTEAGYDLKLYLGHEYYFAGRNKRIMRPLQWYPATRRHAYGTWSVNLKKGLYPFRVVWADYRTDAAFELNTPGLKDYIWTGEKPELLVRGPGMSKMQPIPSSWLKYKGK